jgi:DNA-binding response OmpR family regulator
MKYSPPLTQPFEKTARLYPSVVTSDRRRPERPDRRAMPRGGRRPNDRPGRYPNLLLADSYEGARVPCARYLNHFGFDVDQVCDGDDAMAAIRSRRPHVLIVEAGLPLKSASQLAAWLQEEHRSERAVPLIIMLSDFDGDAPKQLPPAVAVLVKPFPLATLLQEVRRALRVQSGPT